MAIKDMFRGLTLSLISPPTHAVEITPDDDTDLEHVTRAIYVGVQGSVKVDTQGGETVTYVGLIGRLTGRFTRVYATGTDATDIIGEY